jgi:hypothetical protein
MCCPKCEKYDDCEFQGEGCCWECEHYDDCFGEDMEILDDDDNDDDYPSFI